MSVRLSVQLFSKSTASAMEFYNTQEACEKLRHSAATSRFTRRMNKVFYPPHLNSRKPEHLMYNEAEHMATLKENITWLDEWQKYIESLPVARRACFLSKATCAALRITLHSTVALVEMLLGSGFRYVLVGNFGQDPLEVDALAVLFDDVLLEPPGSIKAASASSQVLSPKECLLDYLAGYVTKKFLTMSCLSCVDTLKGSSRQASDLILAKSRGFLQVPSSRLLSLLQIVESYVEELTLSRVACTDVYMNIVERVLLEERTSAAAMGCGSHYVGTTAEVVHFFLRCRLHFFTRERNKLARASKRASCPAGGGQKVIS
ncbi:uncharacterized protein LOC144165838 [Haemaphysalis longicornis]